MQDAKLKFVRRGATTVWAEELFSHTITTATKWMQRQTSRC